MYSFFHKTSKLTSSLLLKNSFAQIKLKPPIRTFFTKFFDANKLVAHGNECFKSQDFNKALQYYNQALQSYPNDTHLHFNKSLALARLGHVIPAIDSLNVFLKQHHKFSAKIHLSAHLEIINLCVDNPQLDLLDLALQHLDMAIELQPQAEFHSKKAQIYFLKKEYQQAHKCIRCAIDMEPTQADFFYRESHIFYAEQLYDEALASVDAAIRLEQKPAYLSFKEELKFLIPLNVVPDQTNH